MLTVDASKSRVIIETEASGLLARVAHDLRIEAPIAEGSSPDGERCEARFEVAKMRVAESSRHKTDAWHPPSPSDAADIESRIRRELFEGVTHITVIGKLEDTRATLTIRAKATQTIDTPVRVEKNDAGAHVTGRCELSLRALGTGKVHVPLGAIKLEDRVVVTFDLSFSA